MKHTIKRLNENTLIMIFRIGEIAYCSTIVRPILGADWNLSRDDAEIYAFGDTYGCPSDCLLYTEGFSEFFENIDEIASRLEIGEEREYVG